MGCLRRCLWQQQMHTLSGFVTFPLIFSGVVSPHHLGFSRDCTIDAGFWICLVAQSVAFALLSSFNKPAGTAKGCSLTSCLVVELQREQQHSWAKEPSLHERSPQHLQEGCDVHCLSFYSPQVKWPTLWGKEQVWLYADAFSIVWSCQIIPWSLLLRG